MTTRAFDVVVSAENTHYLAWQTHLFCYSSLTYLRQAPIVIVHGTDRPLLPEFAVLERFGCRVLEVPSYARTPAGTLCQTRNASATLLLAADVAAHDHVLLCDPDMCFTGALEYRTAVAANYYRFVDYGDRRVRGVLRHVGLADRVGALNAGSKFGPPYFVARSITARLGQRWLDVFDLFEPPQWMDSMPAFGIAVALEGLEAEATDIVSTNLSPREPLPAGRIIHYCYGDDGWDKRIWFASGSPLSRPDTADPVAPPGSLLEELVRQIREARRFFGVPVDPTWASAPVRPIRYYRPSPR